MNTSQRRGQIIDIISDSSTPVSGARLACECGVSRQIIVSDISEYMESLKSGRSTPLKRVISEYHYHIIEAIKDGMLDKIEQALADKNYLVEE